MTRPEPRHLFVYGTLMRGSKSPYAKLLQARAQIIGEATAPGTLYRLGRFPGAVFDRHCPAKVYGEVFRLSGSSLLDALDAYEGCRPEDPEPRPFSREIIEVAMCRGGTLCVWAYRFAGKVCARPPIWSGRFQLR
ncbi:MAG: gamma-glutamylcyclotransferase [Rhodomicrobium sp.]